MAWLFYKWDLLIVNCIMKYCDYKHNGNISFGAFDNTLDVIDTFWDITL